MNKLALLGWIGAACIGAGALALAQDTATKVQEAPPAAAEAAPAGGAPAAEAPAGEAPAAEAKQEEVCFESRKGASEVTRKEVQPGLANVLCSKDTGAVLWYGDPFDGTVPMGKMPGLEKLPEADAVVKPRTPYLPLLAACGTGCHNGVVPPTFPKDKKPVPIPTMDAMYPAAKDLQHGRGRIWCLDCHHSTQRGKLVDNFGDPISFEQPQLLCGKCHGDKLRDWRDGLHGKRIGDFTSGGKKRWFTCPECHDPHNVQDGERNRGFIQVQPETPPQLPHGMLSAKHEQVHPVAH